MREIKFRAWDIINKCYFKFNEYSDEKFSVFNLTEKGEAGFFGDIISCNPDEYLLEQYTGLKDKNGAEIYEGDICRKSFIGRPYHWIDAEISFKNGEYWLGNRKLAAHYKTIEIIGNIRENPELLR